MNKNPRYNKDSQKKPTLNMAHFGLKCICHNFRLTSSPTPPLTAQHLSLFSLAAGGDIGRSG